ncbi:MAG: hypothetical protein KIT84_20235 [Labilithrix sp.]|nr:hypothetical protein [Labilithrix sp.]MCW5813369.1 hypothetical protein [Labilithrix sp.]
MTQLSDELIEQRIHETLSNIEPHVYALEDLLSPFFDDFSDDDDDGGAGLAHLDNLSCVLQQLIEGNAESVAAQATQGIWSEEQRDTWSPFAVQVSNHLYALWPHVVELIELRQQTKRPYGFAGIVSLQRRFNALLSHEAIECELVFESDEVLRKRDEAAYAEYVASQPN